MSIRVLIVDDSPTMQQLLSVILSSDSEIQVVGTAADSASARDLIKQTNPDVVTLDVEMPGMSGIQFLEKIMKLRPMPVVMISSHTQKGADASVDALAIGAFACLAKPRLDDETGFSELCQTIKSAAKSNSSSSRQLQSRASPPPPAGRSRSKSIPSLIVVGASTGGVEALMALFERWPQNCPPTVVVQHMPAGFTKSLANRLNRHCAPAVSEVENYTIAEPGNIYIAPGSVGHTRLKKTDRLRISVRPGDPVGGHMPSVDELFRSAAGEVSENVVGILLTGMGSDGATGLLEMRNRGLTTISQEESSCLVYGMPAAAEKLNASELTMAPDDIGRYLFAATL